MKPLSIAEIKDAVSGKLLQGNPKSLIRGISIDSRKLKTAEMFISIIGEKFDGHNFIPEAVSKGAGALIVDRKIKLDPGIAIIMVKDTTRALQDLAHYYRMKFPKLKVIGVTGSAGKTTTKDIIASILKEKYKTAKTQGNLNNYYGLPLSLLSLNGDEEIVVLEMGMSKLGEISLLTDIARPQIGIITNVGPTHLENLGSVANVARGKRELIEGLSEDGIAILNYDNSYVYKMKDYFQGKEIIYYGLNNKADIFADKISINGKKGLIYFDLNYQGERVEVVLNKSGKHNLYNALAAIAVARKCDMDWNEIKAGLANLVFSPLRWELNKLANGSMIINDAYNANPLSMKAAINATLDLTKDKVITVLGSMLELGREKETAHLELGRFIFDKGVDLLLTVGKLGNLIAKGALEQGMESTRVFSANNNQEAAKTLLELIKPGTTVLVKGSRGMKMEEIVEMVMKQGDKE